MFGVNDANYIDPPDDCDCPERLLEDGWRDGDDLSQAANDVIDERLRQQDKEGWTPEHDDTHSDGSLARAASCYALFASHSVRNREYFVRQKMQPDKWPNSWHSDWWKPTSPRRDLVKAAALLIAEIERIDRAKDALPVDGGHDEAM